MPIATFRDLDKEEDDGKEKQSYFAGGEKSGQLVEGGGDKGRDVAERLMEQAKRLGAVDHSTYMDSQKEKSKFGGTGYRLGEEQGGSEKVKSQDPTVIKRSVYFWEDGFSVDDREGGWGPLRRFDDPAEGQFIGAINQGRVPREFDIEARKELAEKGELHGAYEFDVDLVQKKTKYEAAPRVLRTFGGAGYSLKAEEPEAQFRPQRQAPSAGAPSAQSHSVDESKPSTSIQVRLSNGSRNVVRVNHDHTVGELYALVKLLESGTPEFELLVPFPRKVLSDTSKSIKEEGLLNASIVVKPH
uniref:Uncharacterized protein n=1 Tax=Palpitomonas bilix TaxID=652834 RepID=A0A7S3DHJ3_9EUKA|mmetsp:Transcript_37305/g.96461  ORF Transcript_37305/g.96461 Transcript_37305/m.96461 type:complete len:300 (+) Transcript_37305:131-1030(+)